MAFWVRGLNLTEEDHKILIADGQWLNDHHSDAIIILWAKDVCNRPQSTLLSQSTVGFEAVDTESVLVLYDDHHCGFLRRLCCGLCA